MQNLEQLAAHLRREYPAECAAGKIYHLFKFIESDSDRLCESFDGPPVRINAPLKTFSFRPMPHVVLKADQLKRLGTMVTGAEPVKEDRTVPFSALVKEAMDSLAHPRMHFRALPDGQRAHISTETRITEKEYQSLVLTFEEAEAARKNRIAIADYLDGYPLAAEPLFVKQMDGNYKFKPTGEIITHQRYGRILKRHREILAFNEREAKRDALTPEEIKRNRLRSLTDEADRAA